MKRVQFNQEEEFYSNLINHKRKKDYHMCRTIILLYNQGIIFFFCINHFSLIIFYHSVWLGIELFGLRVQVYSYWVHFYARAQRI